MKKRGRPEKGNRVPVMFRCEPELLESLKEAAAKSGWSLSEQIRFELLEVGGMWKHRTPYYPTPDDKPEEET